MPHAFGYRARTRALHSKAFRRHGTIPLSRRMVNYKIGDYVDIVTDGSVHKGMPHKFYHGRTGKVFDVTQHALGVIVNKVVRNRIVPKRIHVRVEHLRQSRSRVSFIERITANDKIKAEARKAGHPISTKRTPGQPREAHKVEVGKSEVLFFHPGKHVEIY